MQFLAAVKVYTNTFVSMSCRRNDVVVGLPATFLFVMVTQSCPVYILAWRWVVISDRAFSIFARGIQADARDRGE